MRLSDCELSFLDRISFRLDLMNNKTNKMGLPLKVVYRRFLSPKRFSALCHLPYNPPLCTENKGEPLGPRFRVFVF